MRYGMTTEDFDAILEERGCDCARSRDHLVDDEGNPLPPVYYDLTLGEKGRLLWFADYGSRGIQAWNELDRCWEDDVDPLFYGRVRYRVKPEPEQTAPVRQPVQIQGPSGEFLAHGTMIYRDGEWDFDSLEVDNQPDTN